MSIANELVSEIFTSDEDLPFLLIKVIKQKMGLSIGEFSKRSGIPTSTLYKILSGERDPNLRTFRKVIKTIREIEEGGEEKKFIAVIGSRGILDVIEKNEIVHEKEIIEIKEYAVTNMEEAIIAAINTEKDGASALVCAPIVSPTVEKIVNIPVTTIKPRSSVIQAIKLAAKKMS